MLILALLFPVVVFCFFASLVKPAFVLGRLGMNPSRPKAAGIWAATALAFLVAMAFAAPKVERGESSQPSVLAPAEVATSTAAADAETYAVTRVIDGDTIEVEIGGARKTVRYIGVDAPETVHPSQPVGCFGAEASARNRQLVEGKRVALEKDVSETDRYGRLLRYVSVGGVSVNLALVAEGYASASSYPPDVARDAAFREAERQARESRLGLWGDACAEAADEAPAAAAAPKSAAAPAPSTALAPSAGGSCDIKGNISSSGEKIFHVRGCGSYSATVINEGAGERWFCSEDEAWDAGWRKAKNC